MALVKCRECAASVSNSAKTCPLCGIRSPQPRKNRAALLIFLVIVGGFLALLNNGSNDHNQTPSVQASIATTPIPNDETAVINSINLAKERFNAEPNDMAKGGVRSSRKEAICSGLTSLNVKDWVGKILHLSSNSEGKGVLSISIGDDISVETWNNSFSDISDHTLIDPNSSLFKAASQLHEGQTVLFSGKFFSSQTDCIEEHSLTLNGAMTDPNFVFRFTKIEAAN